MTTQQLQCRECEASIEPDSDQAHYAQVSAGTATLYGGMPFDPEQFAMCENCEGNQETPYDY